MEKKTISRSAFLSPRALIALLFCASVCFAAVGTVRAFLRPEAHAKVSQRKRTLTFADRVAYQRAIEEVYWRHRIWPKENAGPKPSLDAVMSRAQIEKKVEDYLRKSRFVADQRGWPITAMELQAEVERMASHTKRPIVLRELFAALGNNPFVVAECLARPALAERFSADLTVVVGMPAAPRNWFAVGAAASTENGLRVTANLDEAKYKLPEVIVLPGCTDDTWTATTIVNAPDRREFHTAVWTGSEMIVWGGFNNSQPYTLNTGGRYDPATDSWTATALANVPLGRSGHTTVWMGDEMIIWGGSNSPVGPLNSGGRYSPATDGWTAVSTANAPDARFSHTAVWAGGEMIVWGGRDSSRWFNSGGRYNPNTDSWTATSTINAPEARWAHTVVWTGSEMIVWGGTNQTIYLNTGGRYNPSTDSWTATGVPNDVLGRVAHTAAWAGGEMIVWGGGDSTFNDCNTGGRYNPTSDSWMATNIANAPSAREQHTAVWTGSEMTILGGIFCYPCMDFNDGGRYKPGTDGWVPTSVTNAPFARERHTAVWTGTEMTVWGGYNNAGDLYLNTGGRYCAQSGPTPTPTPIPTATFTPTATPASPAPTTTATATPMPSSTPRGTPTPRIAPTPRTRPTAPPRP